MGWKAELETILSSPLNYKPSMTGQNWVAWVTVPIDLNGCRSLWASVSAANDRPIGTVPAGHLCLVGVVNDKGGPRACFFVNRDRPWGQEDKPGWESDSPVILDEVGRRFYRPVDFLGLP